MFRIFWELKCSTCGMTLNHSVKKELIYKHMNIQGKNGFLFIQKLHVLYNIAQIHVFCFMTQLNWVSHAYCCSGERYCQSTSRLLGLVLLKSSAGELSPSWVYLIPKIQVIFMCLKSVSCRCALCSASFRKLAVLYCCCHVDLSLHDFIAFMTGL